MVIAIGFEPMTVCLEGRCSIQLSYATIISVLICNHLKKYLSGWQDSNLRPPRPKRGAITGLRYTPKNEVCKFIKENSSKTMVSIKNINQNMIYHYLLYRIFIYLDIKLIIL